MQREAAGALMSLLTLPHRAELSRLRHSVDRNVPTDIIALLLAFIRIMKMNSAIIATAFLCLRTDGRT